MTSPLRDQVAEVLAAHAGLNTTAGWEGSPNPQDPRNIRRVCRCGTVIASSPYPRKGSFRLSGELLDDPHAAHLADVITALVEQREREVRAEVVARVGALADEWEKKARTATASAEARAGLKDASDLGLYAGILEKRARDLRALLVFPTSEVASNG